MSAARALWVCTAALFLAATLPRMLRPGMFLDGVTHAAVARNLALGQGSFWEPFYTETLHPRFHEQPPLALWLESLAFRLAGDHLAVERVFSLAVACATIAATIGIWRALHGRALAWLPVAFWCAVPLASWGVVHNALENVQTAFTTAAVWLSIRALRDARRALPLALLAGAAVLAGCLAKGPVALFALAVPPIAWAVWRVPPARAVRVGLALAAALAAGALGLALWPEARESLAQYLRQQLVPGVLGEREVVGAGRWRAVSALALRVLLPLSALVALCLALARGSARRDAAAARSGLALVGIGLAASLPVALSAKQADRYLLPAVPLLALGAASLALPAARALADRLGRSARAPARLAAGALALAAAIAGGSALGAGGGGRDRARIEDLRLLGAELAPGEVVGICPELWTDWGLHAWGQRLLRVSFARRGAAPTHFLTAEAPACEAPPRCAPAALGTRTLALHRCLTLATPAG